MNSMRNTLSSPVGCHLPTIRSLGLSAARVGARPASRTTASAAASPSCTPTPPADKQQAINRLMGLAVFGEMVAARTYSLMGQLKPEFAGLMRKFASMEGQHATWFRDASKANGIEPDKEFADGELGYLIAQVNDHHAKGDFDALAVVQGFIVESMAIATCDPFLSVADQYPGARTAFQT